jgi:ribonuclease P protein component
MFVLGSPPLTSKVKNTFGWCKKMRKTDEFSSVFRFRCVSVLPGVDLLAAPNNLNFPRLGLIVPKKIIATAVGRNRIKRLIRESFRLNQHHLFGIDVVARIKAKFDESFLFDSLNAKLPRCQSLVLARIKSQSSNSVKS